MIMFSNHPKAGSRSTTYVLCKKQHMEYTKMQHTEY